MAASVHITTHTKGTKMEGVSSISTTCQKNPICQKRAQQEGGVCAHCYAQKLCALRKALETHLEENYDLLTSRLLTPREASGVPISTTLCRIESFGDVANVTQARNYLRIIKGHRLTRFGIWSKNWGIWLAAFKKEGKPRNCTFVLSSMGINHQDAVDPRIKRYVDHVFTVWDAKSYAQFEDSPSHCAGVRCLNCQKCYRRGTSFHINEKLH